MSNATDGTALNYGIVLPNWTVGPDAERLVEFAVAAERAGWDGVFLADTLLFPPPRNVEGVDHPDPGGSSDAPEYDPAESMNMHDPLVAMAGMATRTDELSLVSWIIPLPRRQAWQVARDVATLDRLSGGRVLMGTGLGRKTDYTPFGRPYDQRTLGERYDEGLAVIDGLWRGEPFSYDGEHFTVEEAVVLPTPAQEPRVPVVAGGVWPNRKPIRRGARWDGIVPHWVGDGVIPGGGDVVPERVVRELLECYHDHTDQPGEIMLPLDPPGAGPDYRDVCRELGATWLYARDLREQDYVSHPSRALERIREGPPR